MVHADMCNDAGSFISAAKFPSSLGQVLKVCLNFGNVKIILNNPNPTSSLWLLPGKDVYFNVSILTLFVCTLCLVHAFSCAYIELWMHLGSLESTQEARVALGSRLEELLHFFRALQTSRVHP